MPTLGIDLALHLGIELGIDLAGAAVPPPVLEAPLNIPGLKAWFDSRDTAYFALGGGGEVSAWLSRAGSLGAIAWQQGTAANQPIRVAAEPLLNNQPALVFDGVNDSLLTTAMAAWVFLHDGTGSSAFRVYYMDPAGPLVQAFIGNSNGVNLAGVAMAVNVANTSFVINKGVTPSLNSMAVAHGTKGVARWHMQGHGAAVQHSRVSGSSLTQADGSSPAGASAPTSLLRFGAALAGSSQFLKGPVVQELYYDHVLTAGETTTLANWAASIYGVAA